MELSDASDAPSAFLVCDQSTRTWPGIRDASAFPDGPLKRLETAIGFLPEGLAIIRRWQSASPRRHQGAFAFSDFRVHHRSGDRGRGSPSVSNTNREEMLPGTNIAAAARCFGWVHWCFLPARFTVSQ